jgi:hypothetical protein
MKIKHIFSVLILFISLKTFSQPKITAKEAPQHLNEKVMVCDRVYGGKYWPVLILH